MNRLHRRNRDRERSTLRNIIHSYLPPNCRVPIVIAFVLPAFVIYVAISPLLHHVNGSINPEIQSAEVYHSPEVFKQNYKQMERNFKIFVYPDGDPNTYYHTPRKLTGKYASEGYFFQNIRDTRLRTMNPEEAHMFFIPISCQKMRGQGQSYANITVIVKDYVQSLIHKYPYWNRTLGADHFFVTCHDIGVKATEGVSHLVKNSIRVVCSASYDGDYIPHKDVALPQAMLPFAPSDTSKENMKNRTILAFWAGYRSSALTDTLTTIWRKDTELDIQTNRVNKSTTGRLVTRGKLNGSKFCICPRGSKANTARLVDSIHYGCVPVIMSDYYDLPFNDILNWRKFSVIIKEKDVYHLKPILKNIPASEFKTLQNNLLKVQKHFEWNKNPARLDTFHMVMYELWLRHHVIRY